MKIIIDGQDDLLQVQANFKIAGFANQLDATLYSSGRVIQKIELDENECQLEELEDKLQVSKNQASNLSIETAPLKDHLTQSLVAMEKGMDELEEQAIEISDQMLREGQLGMSELAVWAGDLGQMANNIKQFIQMFQIDESQLKIGSLSFEQGMQKLMSFTSAIIGSLQQEKKMAISDLLQFEISTLITDLKTLFPILIKELDTKLGQDKSWQGIR